MAAQDRSKMQPTCEEIPDEDAPQANVTIKRSNLGELHQAADVINDAATDSGYSSRTAATVSTADSSGRSQRASRTSKTPTAHSRVTEEVRVESPKKKPSSKVKTETPRSERPKEPGRSRSDKTKDRRNVVVQETPPSRKRSDSTARRVETVREDPHRREERPSRTQSRAPPPLDTTHTYPAPSTEAVRSPRYSVNPPQSPYQQAYHRQAYDQGMVEPAYTHNRQRSGSMTRPRPQSFHSADGAYYGQYGRLPAVDHSIRGPPPSASAYVAATPSVPPSHQYPLPMPHNDYYSQGQGQSYDRDAPDPTYSTRTSRSRPASMYGGIPVISQQYAPPAASPYPHTPVSQSPGPSTRYPQSASYSRRISYVPPPEPESESESEDDYEYELRQDELRRRQLDAQRMPPPPLMIPARRPSTHRRRESDLQGISPAQRRLEMYGASQGIPSRSSSSRTRTTYTNTNSTGSSKAYNDEVRRARRQSYAPDEDDDLWQFENHEDGHLNQRLTRPNGRRRTQTETDIHQRTKEARQHQREGELESASDAVLRQKMASASNSSRRLEARKPSDSKSNISNSSRGARSSVTKATQGIINLHVSGKEGFTIETSGDVNGQRIQYLPAADGGTNVVITGGGDEREYYETSRRSEKSSRSKATSSGRGSTKSSQRGIESRTGRPRTQYEDFAYGA